MSEADILATTYLDKCTIARRGAAVKDPDTKLSRQEEITVAQDVPCSLSTPSGGKLELSGGHGQTNTSYSLFCRPDVDVQAGDKIIALKGGRAYALWAGSPTTYSGSHTDTPLFEDEPT